MEAARISNKEANFDSKQHLPRGLTLIELLVVISIISVLMGILLPALSKVRSGARTLKGMTNQRQIVNAANFFAVDNDDRYPESVATIGTGKNWNWQSPTMMTSYRKHNPSGYRAMSEYLKGYIKNASVMFCPSAPKEYRYLQEAWDAGDQWNNPDTPPKQDPVFGTYCFYWGYTGLIEEKNILFNGPISSGGGRRQSTLLVSDYFGYDCWRSPAAYSSCERFKNAKTTSEICTSSAYWSSKPIPTNIDLRLNAGYTDGHIESYSASEVVSMKVIKDRTTDEPYEYGPGQFYIPAKALR